MSLACLACNATANSTDSFRMDNSFRAKNTSITSVRSDDSLDACDVKTACFSKKPSRSSSSAGKRKHNPDHGSSSSAAQRTKASFGACSGVSLDRMVFPEPRLTRCHAVRRDIFSDWTVSDIETEFGSRQLSYYLSRAS